MVLPDGPIATPKDLKGRTIGYSVGFYRDTLLPAMLARYGLKLGDVETVALNFALSQALLSQEGRRHHRRLPQFRTEQMELAGEKGRPIFPEDEGVPAYDELILIANKDNLKDPRITRFLDALERGAMYLVNHPEESWKAFAAAYPDTTTS